MLLAVVTLLHLTTQMPNALYAYAFPTSERPHVTLQPVVFEPASHQRIDTVYIARNDMLRTAMTNNLTLLAASAAAREAETYRLATRSRFDPVLSVGGDADGIGGQIAGFTPTGARYLFGSVAPSVIPGEPLYPNALVASITQPLLRGLGFQSARFSIRAVDEGVAAARARLERIRSEVSATIGVAYAVLVERHRQEAIAERSVRRAEELRNAYRELRALDQITEVDLITAQLAVASRRAAELAFRRNRRDAEDALLFAVYGASASSVLSGGDRVLMPRDTSIVMPTLPSLDSAMVIAMANRADVTAARHEAERAHAQSLVARNALLPSLNLTGAFTSTLADSLPRNSSLSAPRAQVWSLGFVVSRPVRNAESTAERARTLAVKARADVLVSDTENAVRADVRSAYRNIVLGGEQVALASEAAQLARRQYAGERERLTLGLTDIFRVLQYEEQVATVERAEALAWLSLASALEEYRLALGTPTLL